MKKETINIRSDSDDWRGAILSNLTHTPFTVGGHSFMSVESVLQGIKFFDRKRGKKFFVWMALVL